MSSVGPSSEDIDSLIRAGVLPPPGSLSLAKINALPPPSNVQAITSSGELPPNAIVSSNAYAPLPPPQSPNAIVSPNAQPPQPLSNDEITRRALAAYSQQQPQPQQQSAALYASQQQMPDYASSIAGAAGAFARDSNAYKLSLKGLAEKQGSLIDQEALAKQDYLKKLGGIQVEKAGIEQEAANKATAAQSLAMSQEQQKRDEAQKLYDQYSDAAKIDPEHYMKSQSTGGTIAYVLSMMLGGVGAGLTGGPNYVAQIFENKVNNDIRAQIEKRNGLKDLIAEKREQIGDIRAKKMSEMDFINLEKAQRLAGYAAKLGQVESEAQQADVKLAAGKARNELQEKYAGIIYGVSAKTGELNMRGLAEAADAAAKQGKFLAIGPTFQDKLATIGIGGSPISETLMNKALERRAEVNVAKAGISKLRNLVTNYGTQFLTDNSAEMVAVREDIAARLRKINDMGVPSGKDAEMIAKQLSEDPGRIRTDIVKKQLNILEESVENSKREHLKSAGLYELPQQNPLQNYTEVR